MRALRVAARGSDLSLAQTNGVRARLHAAGLETDLVIVKTSGDRITDLPLHLAGGVGLFTREIEEALLSGRADLAVHSLKDLPTRTPPGLRIAAVSDREDPRDLLLVNSPGWDAGAARLPLRPGARVGTSSLRRRAQLLALRPDLEVADLRGNVPTRVRRLREGAFDAVVLARAGASRLGLDPGDLHARVLEIGEMVPAPGQGALALEVREDDAEAAEAARIIHSEEARRAVDAERLLLQLLEGGCSLPLGAHVRPVPGGFVLEATLGPRPGEEFPLRRFRAEGLDPAALARAAWESLREGGPA